jgi:ethanolamine utilization protein EutN
MRIGEVLGRVTLSRSHSSLPAGRLLLTRPLGRGSLASDHAPSAEELVVFDTLGASPGGRIGISEGREAANPFAPNRVPLDAYCACLLDRVNL